MDWRQAGLVIVAVWLLGLPASIVSWTPNSGSLAYDLLLLATQALGISLLPIALAVVIMVIRRRQPGRGINAALMTGAIAHLLIFIGLGLPSAS